MLLVMFRTAIGHIDSRKSNTGRDKHLQILFHFPKQPRCHAIRAMMHKIAQIQPPNHTPQIHLTLPRRDRRADRVGEFVKRLTPVQPGFLVEERDSC